MTEATHFLKIVESIGAYLSWLIIFLILCFNQIIKIPLIKKQLEKFLDRYFQANYEKELEEFKTELKHTTEFLKYDFNRKLVDFNLFTSKKHEVYAELFSKVLYAKSAVVGLEGLMQFLTFEDFDEEDLRKFLENKKVPKGKTNEFLDEFRSKKTDRDLENLANKVHSYIYKIIDVKHAENIVREAKGYFYINAIYFSDDLYVFIKDYFIKLFQLYHIFSSNFRLNDDYEKKISLEAFLEANLEELRIRLRKEISIGYYNENNERNG